MARKRILYISHCAGGGGSPKSLSLLLSSLDRNRYDPIVLLRKTSNTAIEDFFKEESEKIYFGRICPIGVNTHSPKLSIIDLRFFILFLPNIFTVYRIIKREKIDLVYINSSVLVISGIAALLAGVKVVWHIRELIPDSIVGNLQKRIIESIASHIIVISKEMQKMFDKRKTILVYNGIDPAEFKPNSEIEVIKKRYGLNGEYTIFTLAGQLFPVKGSCIFLRAAQLLVGSGFRVQFLVIGGYSENHANDLASKIKNIIKRLLRYKNWKEELEKLARDLAIDDKVIFTGYRDDIPNFLSLSDAVVAPHYVPEPFGRVLIEAGAMTKPVISTNIPPTPEIVINGKTGLLVKPEDPEALAQAMIYIIENPLKAREMGENGYQNVLENFHSKTTHKKIMDLYEKVISSSS